MSLPLFKPAPDLPAHIKVLHVHEALALQQEGDGAHVTALGRQVQRRHALAIEYIGVMVRLLLRCFNGEVQGSCWDEHSVAWWALAM